jgi:hypothetical protein
LVGIGFLLELRAQTAPGSSSGRRAVRFAPPPFRGGDLGD